MDHGFESSGSPIGTVEFVEDLVDGGGRDLEPGSFRFAEVGANAGEHGAWQKGTQQLSAEQRRDLANDPRNLQAVDGPTNGQKSDSDAASWLPPSKGYRCTYVSRQIDVKALYSLWVTQAEKDAMIRVLQSC